MKEINERNKWVNCFRNIINHNSIYHKDSFTKGIKNHLRVGLEKFCGIKIATAFTVYIEQTNWVRVIFFLFVKFVFIL